MKLNCNSFFAGKFTEVNVNDIYLKNKESIPDTRKPEQVQKFVEYYTYGGYAENRKDVWAGTYLDETGGYIHLGIDINVPFGTFVRAPFDADIVDKFTDTDTKIGWGGRLILRYRDRSLPLLEQYNDYPLLVLAHMAPKTLTEKEFVKKGEIIGVVGTWPTNGNTFHHLHVQCITYSHLHSSFDGYGQWFDLRYNPNPFEVNYE